MIARLGIDLERIFLILPVYELVSELPRQKEYYCNVNSI